MIRIALVALLASVAISQPIGEPVIQEKITHSKPVITEQYGPAEIISEEEAHRLVKQYMTEANQHEQFKKLNWQVSGSGNSEAAAISSAPTYSSGPVVSTSSAVSAAPEISTNSFVSSAPAFGSTNFYLAKKGGLQWLGPNPNAALAALAAPKTYTTTTTSFVNSAPSASTLNGASTSSFTWNSPASNSFTVVGSSAPVKTETFKISAPAAPALTTSYQYVANNEAPAVTQTKIDSIPEHSNFEYNSAPAVTVNAAPAVDVAAPSAYQTSSFSYQPAAPTIQFNSAPVQYTSSVATNEAPMTEIVQEKDFGVAASNDAETIEQIKTPASAETFKFGNKQNVNRFGSKF